MSLSANVHHDKQLLSDEILNHTGVLAAKCYQCGKCSAGCPLSTEMDYPPSVIMRMLQTGFPEYEEKVLRSYTIWLCVTCEMCYCRCPMEIDIPKVMDFLREKSLKLKKTNKKAKEIIAFHKAFLSTVNRTGRLFEVGLIAEYKLNTFHLMQDVALAPKMMAKGKLPLIPEKIKDRKNISGIFKKTLKNKEESK